MHPYTALKAHSKAKAQWKQLSPNERRDFIGWINAAKDPDARERRVEESCKKLAAGKRWGEAIRFAAPAHVRFWHKADMTAVPNHVRFRG